MSLFASTKKCAGRLRPSSNCELSCENGRLSSLKFLRPRLRCKGRISRSIGRALACVARVTYFPSRSLSNLLRESVGSLKVEFQSLNQDNSRTTLVAFLNQLPPCREVEQKHMTGRGKKRGDGVHLVTTWRHTCPNKNLPAGRWVARASLALWLRSARPA